MTFSPTHFFSRKSQNQSFSPLIHFFLFMCSVVVFSAAKKNETRTMKGRRIQWQCVWLKLMEPRNYFIRRNRILLWRFWWALVVISTGDGTSSFKCSHNSLKRFWRVLRVFFCLIFIRRVSAVKIDISQYLLVCFCFFFVFHSDHDRVVDTFWHWNPVVADSIEAFCGTKFTGVPYQILFLRRKVIFCFYFCLSGTCEKTIRLVC